MADLTLSVSLEEDEILDGFILVCRTRSPENSVAIKADYSEGLDIVSRRGMLELALDAEKRYVARINP